MLNRNWFSRNSLLFNLHQNISKSRCCVSDRCFLIWFAIRSVRKKFNHLFYQEINVTFVYFITDLNRGARGMSCGIKSAADDFWNWSRSDVYDDWLRLGFVSQWGRILFLLTTHIIKLTLEYNWYFIEFILYCEIFTYY